MRNVTTISVAAVIAFAAATAAAGPQEDYQSLFGKEETRVHGSKSTLDDVAFARKLMGATSLLTDAPELQKILYEKTHTFGVRHYSGYATAAAALEKLEGLEKAGSPERAALRGKRLALARKRYATARGPDKAVAGKALLEMEIAQARVQADAGKVQEAINTYRRAFALAKYLQSDRQDAIAEQIARLGSSLAEANRLKTLREALAKNPKDAAAREALVRFFLVDKDDPKRATDLLAENLSEDFRTNVKMATQDAEDLTERQCLLMGNWYYKSLAESAGAAAKGAMLRRARAYYRRFLSLHGKNDVLSLKARMDLGEVNKQLPTETTSSGGGKNPPVADRGDPEKPDPPKDPRKGRPRHHDRTGGRQQGHWTGARLDANRSWQTVARVKKGDRLLVMAWGAWGGGPEAPLIGPAGKGGRYALEGRIGGGASFRVGQRLEMTADRDGDLQMRMSDQKDYTDNRGQIFVRVQIKQ